MHFPFLGIQKLQHANIHVSKNCKSNTRFNLNPHLHRLLCIRSSQRIKPWKYPFVDNDSRTLVKSRNQIL